MISIRKRIKRAVWRFGQKRALGHKAFLSVCNNFLLGYYNVALNPQKNGEFFTMMSLQKLSSSRIFFDVGSNTGRWSEYVVNNIPDARVHAFEISQKTFLMAQAALDSPRIYQNSFGLSDENKDVFLYHNIDHPTLTSLHEGSGLNRIYTNTERETGHVQTGDMYCRNSGISHICYVKIDAEGHDFFVVKGFAGMLAGGNIDFIQFEHNKSAISSRVYLKDFYDILEPDYRIHRITPAGPVLESYGMFSENFLGANFIAIRKDMTTLLGSTRAN